MIPNRSVPYITGLYGWTEYTPVVPKVYWDVYSQEERIKRLCMGLDRVEKYCDYIADSINEALDYVDDALEKSLEETREELNAFKAELLDLIQQLKAGELQWNVQHGEFTGSVAAQRDMFNDVTVHSLSIEKLNELDMTVDSLANCGLNVRGLAVMSYWLVDKFDIDSDFTFNELEDDRLNATQLGVAKVNEDGVVYIPSEFRV